MKTITKIVTATLCISALHVQAQNVFPANGNVGLGTAAPQYPLHVKNTTAFTANFENPSAGVGAETDAFVLFSNKYGRSQISSWQNFGTRIGSRVVAGGGQGNVYFTTGNDAIQMVINNNGNIGIGTTTPAAKLQITYPDGYASLMLGKNDATGFHLVTEGSTFNIYTGVMGAGINRLRIASNGNIGIGTKTPEANLHVQGNINTPNADIKLQQYNGNIWNISGSQNLYIAKYANGIYSDYLVINPNGNIGIGTTYPGAYKLAVEGKLGAREIDVKQGSWADFVFKQDYNLRSLEEVEKFINKNKHLPDVPSEKEIFEKGINLGNMDATLLQKIEELTLYMIELKKENYKQNEAINDLKDQNKLLTDLLKSVKSK
jgi:hypothetical protein